MYRNDISRARSCRKGNIHILLISVNWITGFLFGCYLGSQLTDTGVSVMHNVVSCPLSFFSLYFVLFFPFVVSAVFIKLSQPLLSLLVTFAKALFVGYCSCGILIVFSSAGWLIRSLVLFSDSLIIILLLWFWIRNIAGDGNKFKSDIILCAVLSFAISCIDYFAVSPFLEALLNM